MNDRYARFANSGPGRAIVRGLGLPAPYRLLRYEVGQPLASGPVALGGAGRLVDPVRTMLADAGIRVLPAAQLGPGLSASLGEARLAALVYDASALTDPLELRSLLDFFGPLVRALAAGARVVVLGTEPRLCQSVAEAAAQRALEGFVRSVGKEMRRGGTAQLIYVAPGAETNVESTLRFLLSTRSAYVSGQVVRIEPAPPVPPDDWNHPLTNLVALVTGAAQGIGAAIARVLARDGALVVCLDRPESGDALAGVANAVGGEAVQLDLTAEQAPGTIAAHLAARHGGVDIVVHNAGVTRDRTLARMSLAEWDQVLAVNLDAPMRITDALMRDELVRPEGRIVGVASIAGIAGNRGQTNYAASKAGVIGLVHALAPELAARSITINAVAPGFIETAMTARMPLLVREVGRRMNSLAQGGLPVDVAETVAWLASPASGGVNGNVVRVCGQSLLGA